MNSPQSSPRPPRPEAATQRHRATPRVAYRRDTRSTLPVATTASDGSPNASAGRTDRRHHQGQSPPFAGSTASAAVRLARMTTALSLPLGRTARCRRADRPACQRVDQACCLRPRGIDVGSWVSAPAPVAVSASGKWSSACCCMCTSRRGCRGHRSQFGLCRGSNRWMSGVPSVRGKRRPGSRGAAPASRAWRARGRCGRGRWSAAADRVRPARSVLDLLTADYKFVDERLARRYGIPNAHGSRFRRVTRAGGRFGVAFVLARLRALARWCPPRRDQAASFGCVWSRGPCRSLRTKPGSPCSSREFAPSLNRRASLDERRALASAKTASAAAHGARLGRSMQGTAVRGTSNVRPWNPVWKWQAEKGLLWPREEGPPVTGAVAGIEGVCVPGRPRPARSVHQLVSTSFLEEWFPAVGQDCL